jgi:hypothetical protein
LEEREKIMRAFAIAALAGLFFVGAHSAFSQQPPTNETDEASENSTRAALQKKRAACRQAGQTQGLRGSDLVDHVARQCLDLVRTWQEMAENMEKERRLRG